MQHVLTHLRGITSKFQVLTAIVDVQIFMLCLVFLIGKPCSAFWLTVAANW